jgi:hypothetical protein
MTVLNWKGFPNHYLLHWNNTPNRNYTNIAQKLSAKKPHIMTTQYQNISNDTHTHTPAHKYHTILWKTSTHKSIPNKPPHHLIQKICFPQIQTYGCTLQLCCWRWVQIASETSRANDERYKQYSIHLVWPELNISITTMYGTTNIQPR